MPKGSKQAPRRTRVKGAPGVYWRATPHGRRYEFVYVDSDGRQRWQLVPGFDDLEAAKTARAEIVAKLGRGEQVRKTHETLGEFADRWLQQQSQLRPRTREAYEYAIERHIKPRLGRRKMAAITADDVALLVAEMRAGKYYERDNGRLVKRTRSRGFAEWTIKGTLTPLNRMYGSRMARKAGVTTNPVRELEAGEKPSIAGCEMHILTGDEIGKLLADAPAAYRPILTVSVFTELRQGEALGLTWADVDLDGAQLHVRKQLARDGKRVAPKTKQAVRDVNLMPSLVRLLREQKERAFAAGCSRPEDFVFASQTGGPSHHRNVVRRGLDKAIENAKLPRLRWHDMRHTAASLLIAEGFDIPYVASQLGHASPNVTLTVYAHLFDAAAHAERANAALEARYGKALENGGGEQRQADPPAHADNVAFLRASATGGD